MLKKALKYTALFLLCVLWMLPQTVRAENPGFASGDQILLEIPEGARGLSAEAGRIGLLGSAFDPETPADSVLWTLQQQTDGSWILENTAGKLSLDEGTLGLTLNGVHDKWNITETEEGLFVLQNTEGGWLLTWFPGPEFFEVS